MDYLLLCVSVSVGLSWVWCRGGGGVAWSKQKLLKRKLYGETTQEMIARLKIPGF